MRPAAGPPYGRGIRSKERIHMSEDKSRSATADESQISLDHEWERRKWSQWLGCSERELQHAVESIGSDPDNVRRFLRQAR
jgi:hypothetical protein